MFKEAELSMGQEDSFYFSFVFSFSTIFLSLLSSPTRRQTLWTPESFVYRSSLGPAGCLAWSRSLSSVCLRNLFPKASSIPCSVLLAPGMLTSCWPTRVWSEPSCRYLQLTQRLGRTGSYQLGLPGHLVRPHTLQRIRFALHLNMHSYFFSVFKAE